MLVDAGSNLGLALLQLTRFFVVFVLRNPPYHHYNARAPGDPVTERWKRALAGIYTKGSATTGEIVAFYTGQTTDLPRGAMRTRVYPTVDTSKGKEGWVALPRIGMRRHLQREG
jgi:hypothetical protein